MALDDDKNMALREPEAGTEVIDVETAMIEAQEKVTQAIAEVEADIIKIETDGELRNMPVNEVQAFIERLKGVKVKLEAIAKGYAETLSCLESEITAVSSLAADLDVEADLSGHTARMEAVSAQHGVVQSTHERVTSALINSQENLEKIKRDYAALHEFAGAIGSVQGHLDQGGTPLVQCVVNFESFPFDDWLNGKMQDPDGFVKELLEVENLSFLRSGLADDRPSRRIGGLVQKFNGEKRNIELKYDRIEDGFKESTEIAELRARLARVPDAANFEPLKQAAEARIKAKLVEEKAEYVKEKKAVLDAELEALQTKFNADVNVFAKENLSYFYINSLLNDGHVKMDELCKYVAENIDRGDVAFPYFLLPEEVVNQVVENLTEEDVKKMVSDVNPLVFTKHFQEKAKSFGLGEMLPPGFNGSTFEAERQKVAQYLTQRGDINSEMQGIEEKSKTLKAEINTATLKIKEALDDKYSERPGFITPPFDIENNESLQLQIDAHNLQIEILDRLIDETEAMVNEFGEINIKYDRAGGRAGGLTAQFSTVLTSKGYATSSAERILNGYGRDWGSSLSDRVVVGNKYFLQSFPEFADVNPNRFSEILREFDNLVRRLSSKLSELKVLRQEFGNKVKEYERRKKFNDLKVEKVDPVFRELETPLRDWPAEISKFFEKTFLLNHLYSKMKELKDGGGEKKWLRERKISVFTKVESSGAQVTMSNLEDLTENQLSGKIEDLANELRPKQAAFRQRFADLEKTKIILDSAQSEWIELYGHGATNSSFRNDLRAKISDVGNLIHRINSGVLSFAFKD